MFNEQRADEKLKKALAKEAKLVKWEQTLKSRLERCEKWEKELEERERALNEKEEYAKLMNSSGGHSKKSSDKTTKDTLIQPRFVRHASFK